MNNPDRTKDPLRKTMPMFRTTARVTYGDTDQMGIAHHGSYVRWFEVGRTEMLRSLGVTYKTLEEQGVFLPVSEIQCRYHSPAMYDDLLNIDVAIDNDIKGAIKFDYWILSPDTRIVHAKGFTKHAFVNSDGRVIRPPKYLSHVISESRL